MSPAAESRKGVGREGMPTTSAGYYSADGGFVREQIYGLVRQLDSGSLSTRDFRVRVAQLGEATRRCCFPLLSRPAAARCCCPLLLPATSTFASIASVATVPECCAESL